jgi:precorrin-6B methylase 2
MIVLVVFWLSVLLFALVLLWILIPALYGLPPVPTKPERIRRALQMAGLQPGETLYDLGAGDGRVLFMAVRDFGAKAVGLEIGPVQCALIWLRVVARGLGHRVQVKWGNYYKADLREADVVFVYATSKEVLKLAPHLEQQMKRGARLVSISADFREWEPSSLDEQELIFIYEMPPTKGSMLSYMLKKAAGLAQQD